MMIRDASDWSPMSYAEAVDWIVQNNDTAWLETGKPSARATAIADLFKKPVEALREDVRAVLAET